MTETEIPTADMITLLQLQEAVATRELVDNRVENVGLRVMQLLKRSEPKYGKWRLRSYRINMRDMGEERKHLRETNVRAQFSVPWSGRPTTKEYGDPADYGDADEFLSSQEEFIRHIDFPHRYLITEGWEHEVLAKLEWERAYYLDYNLEGRRKRVEELRQELAEAEIHYAADLKEHEADTASGVRERHWLDGRP